MAGVDLGRVAYVPNGAYDPATKYNRLDVVSYQGGSFVSLIDNNTGNTPVAGVNWALVAAKGDKGDQGDKGVTGAQGVKGDTGAIGPQGPKGDTGPIGPQGVIGDTGAVGPQGPKGDTGAKGDKGDKGDTGATGATGPQGLKGDKGDQGIQGIQGVKGDKGDPGQNGVISLDAPSDGKTYGRKDKLWAEIVANGSFIIPVGVMDLTSASTSQEISDALGGLDGFNAMVQAIQDGKICLMGMSMDGNAMFFTANTQVFVDSYDTRVSLHISFGNEYVLIVLIYKDGVFTVSQNQSSLSESYILDTGLLYLTSESTSADISSLVGGLDGFNAIKKAIDRNAYFSMQWADPYDNGHYLINPTVYKTGSSIGIFATTAGLYYLLQISYNTATSSFSCLMFQSFLVTSSGGAVGLLGGGNGNRALMDNGQYKNVICPGNVSVATTLTGLSIDNYSIKVTLSAASALSFASTPYEGWECMIDIKNTSSTDITQALPNATGWQCDDTSMTIAAGKIASISVRYVHGVYVVLTRGN